MPNGSMESVLAPYVPRLSAEWEQYSPGARWCELDATCCFVDISGFTALSERLARRGRIGAEELTEVLNYVFGRMLSIAYEKGGSLLKFGGDALLLMFSGVDHAVFAAQAAVAMRAALREARTRPTSVGRLNLRMSTGVHSGTFHFFRVGESHQELIVAGPAASETTRMEGGADAGEIVVSGATAERLPPRSCGDGKGEGRLLRWRKVVEGGPGPPPMRPLASGAVDESISIALRSHLRHAAGESEHRVAGVGFLKFKGVDDLLAQHGADAAAQALDDVVSAVQRAADAEEVTFLASDIDENGGKIILTAGVPVARDDDEGRLLRTACNIASQSFPLSVRLGVNRGHVFAGEIGTQFRRTFTVMGDTVNLAARLMAAAPPSGVYATTAILDDARTVFEIEALEPFYVKGKSQPVEAYAVKGAIGERAARTGSLPFRGRDEELATLRGLDEDARAGRGSAVLIEAERGAGKTRLLDEFLLDASFESVLLLQGEPYGTAVPYLPLRDPMRTLLGITDEERPAGGTQAVDAVARRAPDLVALAPLLAPVLDVDIAPTPESAAIADEFVRDRLCDVLVALLASEQSLCIVAEDAHWFDDATARVTERLAAAAPGHAWLVVVAGRRATAGLRLEHPDVVITLGQLDDGVANELVEIATQGRPLRPQDRDSIVARGSGNPLFLEELLRAAANTQVESLPDSLDAVAMREIDALPPRARRVLRYASVLGPSFDRALLEELLAAEDIELDVITLDDLTHHLLPDGGKLRFRHALFREAAYASLPFRTRLVLHQNGGEAIERRAAAVDDVAALLSMHFLESQDWPRAWRYSQRAAQLAQAAHAPGETAVHLERAITAARRIDSVPSEEVARLLSELGDELITLGLYDRADDAYRRAAAALPNEPLARAQIADQRSCIRGEHQGRFTAGIRQARVGLALLDAISHSTTDVDRARARLLAREADLRYRQGRLQEAARLSRVAMEVAERSGEQRALAAALSVLDSCLTEMGRPGEATNMIRALQLYEQLGDHLHVAITLGNLGGVSFFDSKWEQAAAYYELAVDASNQAGDLAGAAIAHGNLGELRVNQGRLEEADALLAPAVRTLESFGFSVAAAAVALHLGRARAFLGRPAEGVALIQGAAAALDEAQSLVGSLDARARLAEVNVYAGNLAAAANALAEARELERRLGESVLTALVDRIAVTLAAAAGDAPAATAQLGDAVARARRLGATYDLLVLLALGARLGDEKAGDERDELAGELGVVELPGLTSR